MVPPMIRRPAMILALLTGLNLVNYLDRYVLAAVLPKVEEDLGLSHFLGGFLMTVFLLGYMLTSPAIGVLADRGARKGIMAAGVAVWSLATLASGMATGKISMVLARALVGVGEASYATLAPTIIDDLAPPEKRGRWLAIFYVATPIGSALGYLVGGAVGHALGWRAAFYVAGLPGLLLAAACLLLEEPARRLNKDKADVVGAAKRLLSVPLYRRGVLGYCAFTFAIGGFAGWAPSFLYHAYKLDLARANFQFGLLTVVGGALGTVIGGMWADRATKAAAQRLGAGTDPAALDEATVRGGLEVCAWGTALGAPLAAACFLSPSAGLFFAFAFFCETALFLTSSPINTVILRSVPTELRASAMALAILLIHLLGDLWSPPLVGALADILPIRQAMMLLPVAFGAGAAIWWVRRPQPAP